MLDRLKISRFKSIGELTLDCRRVNVFIGEPDTGKTNILEALQVLACLGCGYPVSVSLRLSQELGFDPLFHRQFFDEPARISCRSSGGETRVELRRHGQDGRLNVTLKTPADLQRFELPFGTAHRSNQVSSFRWYVYGGSEHWQYASGMPLGDDVVAPPFGGNLMYVARHTQRVYDFLKDQVASLGWKLKFDQHSKRFRLSEVREDDIFDYNIDLLSDSRKRFAFYSAILLTSEKATLILDEPDVYAFPPFPKLLGEMIAGDTKGNQFFLTTHNPYFLSALAEKTPADDLGLFVCYRGGDGTTQVKRLEPAAVATVIEQGPAVFFNLDELVGR
jgi:hypothetical protein